MSLQEVSLFKVIEFIKYNGGYNCSCLNNFPTKIPTGLPFTASQLPYLLFYLYICISQILKFIFACSIDNILYSHCCSINSVHRMPLLHQGPASAPFYHAQHCLAFQYTQGPEAQLALSNPIMLLMCTSY